LDVNISVQLFWLLIQNTVVLQQTMIDDTREGTRRNMIFGMPFRQKLSFAFLVQWLVVIYEVLVIRVSVTTDYNLSLNLFGFLVLHGCG
jgi:hypothetical protein